MKQRILLASGGVVLLAVLFYFGKTAKQKTADDTHQPVAVFDVQKFVEDKKAELSPSQLLYVEGLENSLTRGDLQKQRLSTYNALADFWKDSAAAFIPYAHYLSQAAILDNSEKKLTFAAQFILDNMRLEKRHDAKVWEAQTAVALFERALKLDPENADLKIGLGSCYIYGPGMTGDPAQTMKGIGQLLEVVREDSTNMEAQMMLGIGAVISNQTGKAIERLNKVVALDPHNLEAVSWLADAYAADGDKQNAIKWYEQSKHIMNNPAFSKAVDERIAELNKQK